MKTILATTAILVATLFATAQELYIKTFGSNKDKPIIFLHGGPGYNCANFEVTTAQSLADKGFFVIVYDRRGEGRSVDPKAKFTFDETFNDLNGLYKSHKIEKAIIIGHSFGGVVATLFAESHPENVESVVLVGAPVSLQSTFKNIISKCRTIYEGKDDKVNLNYISMLEKMDSTTIEYSSYCFSHAMQNGFYMPANLTDEAKVLYKIYRKDSTLTTHASKMTYEGPQGFWKNEHYTTIDLTENLKSLQSKKIAVYGLYGKEDGLYSTQQVADLQRLIGEENVVYLDNCSHNVFTDRQSDFLIALQKWRK